MTQLSIGHLNCHNHVPAMREAVGWGCHSVGLNEADRLLDEARKLRQYEPFTSHRPDDRRGKSSPLLVKRGLEITGVGSTLASRSSTPVKFAPDRFINWVQYEVGGVEIAHVNFHNHALIDNRSTDVDRVKKAAQGFRELDAVIDYLRRIGCATVVSGDLNTRDKAKSPDWQDAGELFRANQFYFRNNGIDWIAWDFKDLRLTKFQSHPRQEVKSDHPGLVAHFRILR